MAAGLAEEEIAIEVINDLLVARMIGTHKVGAGEQLVVGFQLLLFDVIIEWWWNKSVGCHGPQMASVALT
jgi:hypothetical protein